MEQDVTFIRDAVLDLRRRGGSVYYFQGQNAASNGDRLNIQCLEDACELRLVTKDYHRSRVLYVLTKLGWSEQEPAALDALILGRMSLVKHTEKMVQALADAGDKRALLDSDSKPS